MLDEPAFCQPPPRPNRSSTVQRGATNEWKRGRNSFIVRMFPSDDYLNVQDCTRSVAPAKTNMDDLLRARQGVAQAGVGNVVKGPQISLHGETLATIRSQMGTQVTYMTVLD